MDSLRQPHHAPPRRPPVAWGPLCLIAAGLAALLVPLAGTREWFADELYLLAAGHHLSWGYADQPVLMPLLARIGEAVLGGARIGVRLPAVLAAVVGVLITGLIAQEFGGGRGAQALAATTYAISPQTVSGGSLLQTQSVDAVAWAVTTWLVVRWVRLRDGLSLLLIGLTGAVAVQAKYLIAVLWAACFLTVAVLGPREVLRRPALWAGAVVAVLSTLPYLAWQHRHGWPQLRLVSAVREETATTASGPLAFVPLSVLVAGVVAGAVLFSYGLWRLLRSAALAPYRFLGWTCVVVLVVFLVSGGRYYYCAGLFPLCFAAGAVELLNRTAATPRRAAVIGVVWPVSAVLSVLLVVLPHPLPGTSALTAPTVRGSAGWRELADAVAHEHRTLPARGTPLVTAHFWQASALDRYGRERGLPEAHSPHRGYWFFGPPPDTASALVVGVSEPLRANCRSTRQLTTFRGELGYPGINDQVPIWLCEGRIAPWQEVWPSLYEP
ncbi:glycosyl transferase, family 39 [Saccharopolyspora rhizosphaerae]|uniref:Glycosyl transferase, family 39 n=1 Tax=Saccharopolyspora rhizosphaerae TaxID=2492662 RepID=A0A3R8R598_9PSEU|nr:glycosyltransferase family 39 protein [Saccharopolyspora rhizosphaerae]RRO18689.1 glycosyl transferase, family 39 [Saccharopolyspora rhizosphaerae]